jgi:predicted Zn-dependent protease
MIERRLPTADFEREAIDRLSRHLAQATNSVETWTATQADVALRLSAILLRAAKESSLADETESETEREHGNSLRPQGNSAGSSRLQQATVWLTRVNMYLELHRDEPATAASTTLLRQRAIPLQIIVLAGKGKVDEAEELLKSLKNTSPELLLAVMEGLSQFISSKSPATGDSVAALSLRAGELLGTDRDQLAPVQRSLLDQYLTTAYLATGQTAKAVNLMKSRAEQGPKDVEIQREIGLRLSSLKSPEAAALAKQCWRRVESLTKGGSAEWFVARLEVLRACLQLNQVQEGRKLLQVTKVLYPDLGGKPLADQFEAIDRAFPASAVPGK